MSRGKFNSIRTKHLRILIFGDFMASRSPMKFPETMFNLLGRIEHKRAADLLWDKSDNQKILGKSES
jgi:hypothetical protein